MIDYFMFADTLYLYWRDDLSSLESLAAILENGKLTVFDKEAYHKFMAKHERDRKAFISEILPWNDLLECYFNRY